jgi:ell wall binding domain 2 (CWB2)
VPRKRPINADLPPTEVSKSPAPKPPPVEASASPAQEPLKPKRQRKPLPAALKAIAGLVLVAVVFLVAAILGGGRSEQGPSTPAPTQAPADSESRDEATPTSKVAEELGYPSFATNNTVRIGGSDPAAIAAAVSLAVFPSATPVQRPAAVTLVDEGEWQGAVAAAVLMAEPLRAPLLVASGGELPEATAKALEALAPAGNADSGGAQAFAVGAAEAPDDLTATRLPGSDPAGIAATVAAKRDELFGKPPAHVVIASETQPEFAIPAAAWAARSSDPVLFTAAQKLPAPTAKALRRHPKVPVYVLGPSSAISSQVVREIAKIGPRVRRVAGEDPVANAIALARYASGDFGWNVNDPGHGFVLSRSDAALEAAVAAPLSASGTWGPLLLSDDADTLPSALREYMLDVKPGYTTDPTRAFYNHVWVIGDQEAIDVNQQAEIDQLAELAKIGNEP